MSTSAEGIVENAATFTGVVRAQFITILLVNKANEPIPNLKCKVEFKDGQTTQVKSNSEGILKVHKKAKGEIKLLEEEEPPQKVKVQHRGKTNWVFKKNRNLAKLKWET